MSTAAPHPYEVDRFPTMPTSSDKPQPSAPDLRMSVAAGTSDQAPASVDGARRYESCSLLLQPVPSSSIRRVLGQESKPIGVAIVKLVLGPATTTG
jgi:hypothetical protein